MEAAKLYQSLVQQANVVVPWATYEVMAGMPGPTYLVFSPHKTLPEIDPATGVGATIQKAMTQDVVKKFGELSGRCKSWAGGERRVPRCRRGPGLRLEGQPRLPAARTAKPTSTCPMDIQTCITVWAPAHVRSGRVASRSPALQHS